MPNVPYSNTQVSPDVVPTPRIQTDHPIEDFGGGRISEGVEKGVNSLSAATMDIAERSYKAANAATKMNGQNNANTAGNSFLYGTTAEDGNQIPGILQRISGAGANAHAVSDEGLKQLKALGDTQIAGAKSKEEADILSNIWSDKYTETQKLIQPHLASEQQKYEAGAVDGSVSGFQDVATGAYAHPEIVDQNVQKLIQARDEYAANHGGIDAPQNQQLKSLGVSKLYQGVVEKYFNNGQDVQGKEYYEKIKDRITDGKISNELDKLVRNGSMDGDAQRTTNSLLSKYSSKGAAQEEIQGIKDVALRDKVQAKFDTQLAIKNQQSQAVSDNNFLQAQDIAIKQGFDHVPQALKMTLDQDSQDALQKISDNASGAIPIKNNSKVFIDYMYKSPQQMAAITHREIAQDIRPYLDDAHFKEFSDQWQDSHAGMGGDQKALSKANYVQGNQNSMVESFTNAGIAKTKAGESLKTINLTTSKRTAFDDFRNEVQAEVTAQQMRKGEPLTPQEYKKVTGDIAAKTVLGSKPDFEMNRQDYERYKELDDEQKKNYAIPITKLTDADKQKIYEAGLMSGGISPTMKREQAYIKYRSNFEKAAGAAARGADMNEIRAIMGNK